ncbi:MAG: glycoside hydrolase family 2 TIM barrel-domain containing protein, partial [Silanimonas sp.]
DAIDRITDRVGLRRIEVRGPDLYLNGERLFLRGISLHEERFGAEGGRVRTAAEARALLQAAKDLGANFVRLAHYPHSEATTRLADEMGLLVWSEIPVYWDEIRYGSPDTLALARRMQAVNIDRDFNRASIILWSVANETSITPARNAFLRRLIDDTRAFDGTRLVTAALNKAQSSGDEIRIVDPLGDALDVIAVNQYEGWYGQRTPAQITDVRFTSDFDKPFVFSEFGADAPRTFRAAKEVRWSADYQRWLYAQNLALFDTMPGLDGLSPWILKDFRVPRRWHGRFQDYWNRKGLLDEEGRRKPAFDTLRAWYQQRAEADAAARTPGPSAPAPR